MRQVGLIIGFFILIIYLVAPIQYAFAAPAAPSIVDINYFPGKGNIEDVKTCAGNDDGWILISESPWQATEPVDKYEIEQSEMTSAGRGTWGRISSSNPRLVFGIDTRSNQPERYYRVRAVGSSGSLSSYSPEFTLSPGQQGEACGDVPISNPPLIPYTPTNLSVSPNCSQGRVVLNWRAPTVGGLGSSIIGYNVYRDNEIVGPTVAGATTFEDNNIKPDQLFYYFIRAVGAGGESHYSNTVTALCPASSLDFSLAIPDVSVKTGQSADTLTTVTLNFNNPGSLLTLLRLNVSKVTDSAGANALNTSNGLQFNTTTPSPSFVPNPVLFDQNGVGPSVLTIDATKAKVGSYSVEIEGAGEFEECTNYFGRSFSSFGASSAGCLEFRHVTLKRTKSFKVTVTSAPAPLDVSCYASPTRVVPGQSVTWTAVPSGGDGTYRYPARPPAWTGTDGLSGRTKSVSTWYILLGRKTAAVTVTSAGQTKTNSCDNIVSVVGEAPKLVSASANSCPATPAITLSWTPPPSGGPFLGYFIYRDGVKIGFVDRRDNSFTDSGLDPGTTYSYYVATSYIGGESASNVLSATTAGACGVSGPSVRLLVKGTGAAGAPAETATVMSGNTADLSWEFTDQPENTICTASSYNTDPPGRANSVWTGDFSYPGGLQRDTSKSINQNTTFRFDCKDVNNLDVTFSSNSVRVSVSAPRPLTVTCRADPTSVDVGNPLAIVEWKANPSGGIPPYSYLWGGSNNPKLAGGKTNPVEINYFDSNTGYKYGRVTVTDSANTKTPSTDCLSGVSAFDSRADYQLIVSPTATLTFISQSASSNKVAVSVARLFGFAETVIISASPDRITAGGVTVPLEYGFYDSANSTLISKKQVTVSSGQYPSGIYMVVTARKRIPAGSYPNFIKITAIPVKKINNNKSVNLKVNVIDPKYEEF